MFKYFKTTLQFSGMIILATTSLTNVYKLTLLTHNSLYVSKQLLNSFKYCFVLKTTYSDRLVSMETLQQFRIKIRQANRSVGIL